MKRFLLLLLTIVIILFCLCSIYFLSSEQQQERKEYDITYAKTDSCRRSDCTNLSNNISITNGIDSHKISIKNLEILDEYHTSNEVSSWSLQSCKADDSKNIFSDSSDNANAYYGSLSELKIIKEFSNTGIPLIVVVNGYQSEKNAEQECQCNRNGFDLFCVSCKYFYDLRSRSYKYLYKTPENRHWFKRFQRGIRRTIKFVHVSVISLFYDMSQKDISSLLDSPVQPVGWYATFLQLGSMILLVLVLWIFMALSFSIFFTGLWRANQHFGEIFSIFVAGLVFVFGFLSMAIQSLQQQFFSPLFWCWDKSGHPVMDFDKFCKILLISLRAPKYSWDKIKLWWAEQGSPIFVQQYQRLRYILDDQLKLIQVESSEDFFQIHRLHVLANQNFRTKECKDWSDLVRKKLVTTHSAFPHIRRVWKCDWGVETVMIEIALFGDKNDNKQILNSETEDTEVMSILSKYPNHFQCKKASEVIIKSCMLSSQKEKEDFHNSFRQGKAQSRKDALYPPKKDSVVKEILEPMLEHPYNCFLRCSIYSNANVTLRDFITHITDPKFNFRSPFSVQYFLVLEIVHELFRQMFVIMHILHYELGLMIGWEYILDIDDFVIVWPHYEAFATFFDTDHSIENDVLRKVEESMDFYEVPSIKLQLAGAGKFVQRQTQAVSEMVATKSVPLRASLQGFKYVLNDIRNILSAISNEKACPSERKNPNEKKKGSNAGGSSRNDDSNPLSRVVEQPTENDEEFDFAAAVAKNSPHIQARSIQTLFGKSNTQESLSQNDVFNVGTSNVEQSTENKDGAVDVTAAATTTTPAKKNLLKSRGRSNQVDLKKGDNTKSISRNRISNPEHAIGAVAVTPTADSATSVAATAVAASAAAIDAAAATAAVVSATAVIAASAAIAAVVAKGLRKRLACSHKALLERMFSHLFAEWDPTWVPYYLFDAAVLPSCDKLQLLLSISDFFTDTRWHFPQCYQSFIDLVGSLNSVVMNESRVQFTKGNQWEKRKNNKRRSTEVHTGNVTPTDPLNAMIKVWNNVWTDRKIVSPNIDSSSVLDVLRGFRNWLSHSNDERETNLQYNHRLSRREKWMLFQALFPSLFEVVAGAFFFILCKYEKEWQEKYKKSLENHDQDECGKDQEMSSLTLLRSHMRSKLRDINHYNALFSQLERSEEAKKVFPNISYDSFLVALGRTNSFPPKDSKSYNDRMSGNSNEGANDVPQEPTIEKQQRGVCSVLEYYLVAIFASFVYFSGLRFVLLIIILLSIESIQSFLFHVGYVLHLY